MADFPRVDGRWRYREEEGEVELEAMSLGRRSNNADTCCVR